MPVNHENNLINQEKQVVWIVEDDALLNDVIQRSLNKSGFTCKKFFSGNELLDYISTDNRQKEDPILLLDFLLDDMNAIDLLSGLKKLNSCFPFVIMTGFGDEKTAVELMKLGAIDYVVKEKFFVDKIVKVIRQASEKIETDKKLEQSRVELEENARQLKLLNAQINLQKLAIEDEKAKSDKLLLSVLPKKIARELLEKGYTKPRQFLNVSILFADVIGFSDLAKTTDPIELVTRLDNYFYIFDEIVEHHGLEKIKTIGDCYMCAGGIPEENDNNAVITVLAGLKIQDTIQRLKQDYNKNGNSEFRLRLGIHSGEVVAGVVGKIKFAYDIWGDAVNVASRIVEAGEKDKVNISEKTYLLVRDFFIFTTRGNVITKRNYPMKMYFVERLKPEFSADDSGIIPNEKLMNILKLNYGIRHY
jgi:class 3 adenylate cyclase